MSATSSPSLRELVDRPAPGPHFTEIAELRDFLDAHLPTLTHKQHVVVVAWSVGYTCAEIAMMEGVTERAVRLRLASGLFRLRQLAGVEKIPSRPS